MTGAPSDIMRDKLTYPNKNGGKPLTVTIIEPSQSVTQGATVTLQGSASSGGPIFG
jgi:hypothetical protein